MLLGFATSTATQRYADRFSKFTFQQLGRTGLTVSQAGFGCYRVSVLNDSHHAAIVHALTNGINLVDTSSNYADGGSERLVGEAVAELSAAQMLSRDEVVVVTKGGYLQGHNFALSQTRKKEGRPFPDLVEYGPQLEHCIHPEFLEDQIDRSLARLQLEHIDVYLLHNPEYYLGWAKKMDLPAAEARAEYERRLILALGYLESEVARGRIRAYGISSNSFSNPYISRDFTDLSRLLELIDVEIGSDHHFSVIQFPMNLIETGGVTERNQPQQRSVLEVAEQHNLGVLINRPLNAVMGNNLIRLADLPPATQAADRNRAQTLVLNLAQQESRLHEAVFNIDIPFRTKQEFTATAAAGRLLQERWDGFGTLSNWRDVRDGYLRPRLQFTLRFLQTRPELPEEAAAWVTEYEQVFMATMDVITAVYRAYEAGMLAAIKSNVGQVDSQWRGAQTMSQAAIRSLRTTAGISSVLVGMRQKSYVEDVLADLQHKIPQSPRTAAWEQLAASISIE